MKTDLVTSTDEFFSLHWNLEEAAPTWDFSWEFIGPVPNYLLGGVYALLKNNEVVYIGLGTSKGGGIYKNRGLSRRLMSHVTLSAPKESMKDCVLRERWASLKVDKIATIGFPVERNYLAAALEEFLIGRLNPSENAMKKS